MEGWLSNIIDANKAVSQIALGGKNTARDVPMWSCSTLAVDPLDYCICLCTGGARVPLPLDDGQEDLVDFFRCDTPLFVQALARSTFCVQFFSSQMPP